MSRLSSSRSNWERIERRRKVPQCASLFPREATGKELKVVRLAVKLFLAGLRSNWERIESRGEVGVGPALVVREEATGKELKEE